MKITKERKTFEIDNEEIIFADLLNRESLDLFVICKSGKLYILDLTNNKIKQITEQKDILDFKNIVVYSHKNYICVVENRGIRGVVVNSENRSFSKKLFRGNYYVENCSYPIAFYEYKNGIFLIHGTDWNRLDITHLNTDSLLTERVVDYDTKTNYFDYFHSRLSVSPNYKNFISNGWIWSPYDYITAYSIEEFLEKYELSYKIIEFEPTTGYNWDRPLCWINDELLCIGYNKQEEKGTEKFPSELIFVNIVQNEIVNRIEFNGFEVDEGTGEVYGEVYFNQKGKYLVGVNDKEGILISDLDGKEIFQDRTLVSYKYSEKGQCFYKIDYEKREVDIRRIAAGDNGKPVKLPDPDLLLD